MTVSVASRVLSPILLLAGTFGFGVLPIAVQRTLLRCDCTSSICKSSCRARKGKVITSFLIYLGGGVLLATCLIHLLPEAREGFEKHNDLLNKKKVNQTNFETTTLLPSTAQQVQNAHDHHESEDDGGHHEEFPIPEFVVCCGFFAVYLVEEIIHFFLGGHSHIPTETRAIRSLSRSNSCPYPSDPAPETDGHDRPKHERTSITISNNIMHCEETSTAKSYSSMGFSVTALLTVAALSFHSLFEGFAIGLQNTDSGMWILFAAVSVHKFVLAFVVGLDVLAGGGKAVLVFIYMSVFSAMSPIGMVIAMITQIEAEESSPLTVGILNAIATGTLLYVTFCEILQREEHHNNLAGWQQFLATLLGFSVMCLVQYASTFA